MILSRDRATVHGGLSAKTRRRAKKERRNGTKGGEGATQTCSGDLRASLRLVPVSARSSGIAAAFGQNAGGTADRNNSDRRNPPDSQSPPPTHRFRATGAQPGRGAPASDNPRASSPS